MRTDEELVSAIRRGEGDAFDVLYRRYHRRLFSYILRLVKDRPLAEDLFQDVFMAVLEKADSAAPARQGRFGGWLFRVARNRCLNTLRDRDRGQQKLRALASERAAAAPGREPGAASEARQLLEAALASLSVPHQDALILKEVAGLTYREIAAVQDVPEGTAKSRLHFAVKAIRRFVRDRGQEEAHDPVM